MNIDRSSLAAVHVAAKEKSRYAINHLCIAPDGTAIATDGRMLLSIEPPENEKAKCKLPESGVLLPSGAAKELDKRLRGSKGAGTGEPVAQITRVTSAAKDEPGKLTVEAGSNGSTIREVIELGDGNFPAYRDVLPALNGNAVRVRVDLGLLKKFVDAMDKAAKASGTGSSIVELSVISGDKPIVARCRIGSESRRALGLIMPVTCDNSDRWQPSEWEKRHWKLTAPANGKGDKSDIAKPKVDAGEPAPPPAPKDGSEKAESAPRTRRPKRRRKADLGDDAAEKPSERPAAPTPAVEPDISTKPVRKHKPAANTKSKRSEPAHTHSGPSAKLPGFTFG